MAQSAAGGPDDELDVIVDRLGDGEIQRLLLDAAARHGDVARAIIADGDIGWQDAVLWTCDGDPSPESCTDDGGELIDDERLTPLVGSQIRAGDVISSRVTHLDLGEVGFVFMLPGGPI